MPVGQHFTPAALADALLSLVPIRHSPARSLDPSCGRYALLDAVRRRWPTCTRVGLDNDPECRGKTCDFLRWEGGLFPLVVTNPPYLGGRKISGVMGGDYLRWLCDRWGLKGTADLASVHVLKASRHVEPGGYLAIIGTNTLRQGASRRAGYARMVESGEFVAASKDRPWPGAANVIVDLVLWRRRAC